MIRSEGDVFECAKPVCRGLLDAESGALASKRYLIIDRDTKYTQQFRRLIDEGGTEVIRLPPMSPNLNAYAERFVRSIKDECLGKMIFVGRRRCVERLVNTWFTTTRSAIIKGWGIG